MIDLGAINADGQRLDATHEKPARERRQRSALGVLQKCNFVGQLVGRHADHATCRRKRKAEGKEKVGKKK